jgi:hypothetical protein
MQTAKIASRYPLLIDPAIFHEELLRDNDKIPDLHVKIDNNGIIFYRKLTYTRCMQGWRKA